MNCSGIRRKYSNRTFHIFILMICSDTTISGFFIIIILRIIPIVLFSKNAIICVITLDTYSKKCCLLFKFSFCRKRGVKIGGTLHMWITTFTGTIKMNSYTVHSLSRITSINSWHQPGRLKTIWSTNTRPQDLSEFSEISESLPWLAFDRHHRHFLLTKIHEGHIFFLPFNF